MYATSETKVNACRDCKHFKEKITQDFGTIRRAFGRDVSSKSHTFTMICNHPRLKKRIPDYLVGRVTYKASDYEENRRDQHKCGHYGRYFEEK